MRRRTRKEKEPKPTNLSIIYLTFMCNHLCFRFIISRLIFIWCDRSQRISFWYSLEENIRGTNLKQFIWLWLSFSWRRLWLWWRCKHVVILFNCDTCSRFVKFCLGIDRLFMGYVDWILGKIYGNWTQFCHRIKTAFAANTNQNLKFFRYNPYLKNLGFGPQVLFIFLRCNTSLIINRFASKNCS
jgi:hypothetical protein